MVVDEEKHPRRIDHHVAFLASRADSKTRVPHGLLASQRLAILQDDDFSRRGMGAGHNQVYGGRLVFQSQSVPAVFDSFEVFGCRSPPSACVEEILFRLTAE